MNQWIIFFLESSQWSTMFSYYINILNIYVDNRFEWWLAVCCRFLGLDMMMMMMISTMAFFFFFVMFFQWFNFLLFLSSSYGNNVCRNHHHHHRRYYLELIKKNESNVGHSYIDDDKKCIFIFIFIFSCFM